MNKIITSALIISILGFQTIGAMAGGANLDENLLHSAFVGNLGQVRYFMGQGANVNAANVNGDTALHHAANGGYYDIIHYLLERHRANPNIASNTGHTPLHYAVSRLHDGIVELLLRYGADPTLRTANGETPMDILRQLTPAQQKSTAAQRIRQYLAQAVQSPEVADPLSQTTTP